MNFLNIKKKKKKNWYFRKDTVKFENILEDRRIKVEQ